MSAAKRSFRPRTVRRRSGVRRWLRAAGAAFAAALVVGCGQPEAGPQTLEGWIAQLSAPEERLVEAAVVELGKRGRADPDKVIPLLAASLAAWRDEGDIHDIQWRFADPPRNVDAGTYAALLSDAATALALRLSMWENSAAATRVESDRIHMRLPRFHRDDEVEKARLEQLLPRLEAPLELQWVDVLDAEPANGAARIPDAWDASLGSPAEWAAKERTRFEAAEERREPYVPQDPRFPIVPLLGPAGRQTMHLVFVPPHPDDRLGRKSFRVKAFVDPQGKQPSQLEFTFHEATLAKAKAWSTRRTGKHVALLLDAVAVASLVLDRPFDERMSIVMGGPDVNAREWFLGLAVELGPPPLPRRLVATVRPPGPLVQDPPPARALVEVGAASEAALAAIQEARGPSAAAARWARQEIIRRLSRSRDR